MQTRSTTSKLITAHQAVMRPGRKPRRRKVTGMWGWKEETGNQHLMSSYYMISSQQKYGYTLLAQFTKATDSNNFPQGYITDIRKKKNATTHDLTDPSVSSQTNTHGPRHKLRRWGYTKKMKWMLHPLCSASSLHSPPFSTIHWPAGVVFSFFWFSLRHFYIYIIRMQWYVTFTWILKIKQKI